MTHKWFLISLQVGIFGPPDTLYQGGYFKVSLGIHRNFPFFSTTFKANQMLHYIKNRFCNELFQGPRIVKPFFFFVSCFCFSMFISLSLYIFASWCLINDDTSSVFHTRIIRKRTNNKRTQPFTVSALVFSWYLHEWQWPLSIYARGTD